MKKYYKILFIAIFIFLGFSKAFGDDYLFYKCNNKELKIKALYFYTQNTQINKFNIIQSLEKSGYKNLGSPSQLLIRNNNGFVISSKLLNLSCKMRGFAYKITIGSMAGNPNPAGQCGAFNSHWVIITKNNKVILPKTLLQSCNSQSAISEITLNPNGQIQVYRTNPYSQSESINPIDLNKNRTIYVGQAPDAIATDQFGNIWVANYQSQNIAKINQEGKVDYFDLKGSPTSIAIDSYGNVFTIVKNSVIKLTQEGKIAGIYKISDGLNYVLIDPKNNIWVDDWKNGKVYKLNENGNIIDTYQAGNGAYKMAIDKAGNLWIVASYDHLMILYPNGYMKKCPQCCVSNIIANDNTAWITTGKLLDNSVFLRHINSNCEILPQSYKLDIQPTGIAIDNKDIWVSGNKKYGEGVLEEINESGKKHTYALGKFPGPLVIDKYGNVWVISGPNTVTEFYGLAKAQYTYTPPPQNSLNPHLPIAIHHTFPENNIGK
ncbi:MAG: hypothetical protein ACP5GK_08800 [Desulfurella sp.]|uniref:hypothetical protein n=1 Tax=Desulfurella sp. TaxID=1962857 RepID=UPI003D13BD4F